MLANQEQEPPPPPPLGKVSLLQLAENSMAQAMLIFLMADLRNLSATGRIRTKFDYLSISSDNCSRQRARDFIGYPQSNRPPDDLEHNNSTGGVRAIHIMAVLLLEITRASDERRLAKGELQKSDSIVLDSDDSEEDQYFGRADLQSASGLPALLRGYHSMLAEDIVRDIPLISKAEWPLDPRHEEENQFDRSLVSRPDFDFDVEDDEEEKLFSTVFGWPVADSIGQSIRQALGQETSKQGEPLQELANLQDSLFVNAELHSSNGSSEFYSKGEIIELLEQAIEKKDFARLGFMRSFFKEGSICSLLLESKSEMVWLNDWHLKHECTYAISVDREKKKIFLTLRGSRSRSDSAQAFDVSFTATGNPVQEHYPGRPRNVRIRGIYHKYLFRVRKDTGTTKYDEIVARLACYCNELGSGVTISMTGHSVGAALATLVAFYASTDPRFNRNGAIEVVTFGCPYIGGYKFADAVMHQEAKGLIRIARFHNARDGAAHLPPTLFSFSKRGATYFHNGIDIKFPLVRQGVFKIFGQPQPIVKYNGRKSFLSSAMQQVKDFYFFNLPLRFWMLYKMHPLVEHQKRLRLVNLLKDPSSSPLVRYSLEELYEIRDELN